MRNLGRRLARLLLAALHAAFWIALILVLVCVLGALRWAKPGANPTAADLIPFGISVLVAFGLFTIFYVYDTFFGEQPETW